MVLKISDIDKKLEELRREAYYRKDVELALNKWMAAKQYWKSKVSQKVKNSGKDLRYRTRKRFFIPLDLIRTNPKKFIDKVDKWFKEPWRYDIEGLDDGKNIDDEIFIAYLNKLSPVRRRKVINEVKINNGLKARIYKNRGSKKK